ncbi:heavy metal translocating P-type ATPase [Leifsonia shinshuensis]|uniref:Cation-transporting P-type ATPase B n=1 Tax=Leifsonia shinshuensis TaxID=150026 RepID=A0A7G6YFU2_9MICO|nr:heavy metal translocating P-type ATPase [Leifsonia shinshuensis]QNE37357.1 copper-translocating P-type ATPase [Leifsonia shinshuensis]
MSATDAERAQPRLELLIGGMTCASCAARVEKKLNKLDGVEASVNYATEKATVFAPAGYDTATLVAQVESAGYTAALPAPPASSSAERPADPELASLRRRLIVSATLGLPVVLLSMIPVFQFPGWQWLALALAAPVVVWGAWPFHRAAAVNLRHGAATMDTLVSLGVTAAFAWSLYALVFGGAGVLGDAGTPGISGADLYLEVAAGVTVFVLAGRYLEKRSKRRAGAALRALLESGAKEASVLRDAGGTREERIPVERLAVGDVFVVRPGERIATDGVVTDGSGAVDASMLTGESVPVEVGPGDSVTGGTVNAGGRLIVRATTVGADTKLAQIARLVEDAQSGKAAAQRLADRISGVFVPVVIGIALVTLAAWLLLGGPVEAAFTAAVAVLIIACPCALGLATPTALLVGTGRGAQLGILITGPEVLEATRRVDTVLLDKTGTVTTGRMTLVDVVVEGGDGAEALRRAGAVEDASEHPIGRAIADAARNAGPLPAVAAFRTDGGLGVSGTVDGERVVVGRASFVAAAGMPLGDGLQQAVAAAEASGTTAVVAGWGDRARAVLAVADAVAPRSAEAVRRLKRLGLTPVLLTGDNGTVARRVADEVGIDEVIAGVLPAGKAEVVRRLQAEGRRVAMVGDGVNDAAALAAADLGLAMGTGTDAAIQAADLTLVRGELTAAADAVRLSRRTLATIHGNLFWAFAYNLAALPLAAFGLLNPMIAGAAMAFSSVFVVTNSLRLRSFRPERGTAERRAS